MGTVQLAWTQTVTQTQAEKGGNEHQRAELRGNPSLWGWDGNSLNRLQGRRLQPSWDSPPDPCCVCEGRKDMAEPQRRHYRVMMARNSVSTTHGGTHLVSRQRWEGRAFEEVVVDGMIRACGALCTSVWVHEGGCCDSRPFWNHPLSTPQRRALSVLRSRGQNPTMSAPEGNLGLREGPLTILTLQA